MSNIPKTDLHQYRKVFCLLICLCFCLFSELKTSAQATGDAKEDFLYGEYYLTRGLFSEALPFYLSSLQTNAENSNINYRAGLCYSKIIGEQHKALPYLEKAIKEINTHYIDGKYLATGAPIEAWLLLGDAYLRNDQHLEASKAYHEYKRLLGNSDDEMYRLVMQRISGLGISYEFQRQNVPICLMNFGYDINSRFSDYNPVVNGEQNVLIYSQFWESYDRIFISRLVDEKWTAPEEISIQMKTDGLCYTSAISFDGSELYLVCHDETSYDLYTSKYSDGRWSEIKLLPGKINSRYRESSVSVSADGNILYFASDRPGGEGGFDIYQAKKSDGEWSEIKNLGKPLNTQWNEEAPYISSDGLVLYFSSNGHESVGNMDILYSELDESLNWQAPKNIGSPVNTTNDDIFYSYFKETQTGYLSRDLPQGSGKNDLYIVQYGDCPALITGYVVDPLIVSKDIASANSKRPSGLNSKNGYTSANKTVEENKSNEVVNNEAQTFISNNKTTETITNSSAIEDGGELESGEAENEATDFNFIEKQLEEALVVPTQTETTDSLPVYTIQIFAMHNPINPKKIKLPHVKISQGNDGLYRYTYGEFIGYSVALKKLEEMRVSGYPDSFIRNITTVPNYSR